MTYCLPCIGNIKHATLINNCYPPYKEGSHTPHSSELSYLTFYASSRPAKLTKVGSFLLKKVTRDIRKGRKTHVQVSLYIIKALIQTCHRDLNIFSKYIVQILSMVLDTRDLELIDLTCETFIVFCGYHDGTTLGVDADFTSDYELLINKLAGFCTYTNEDPEHALRMRYVGHRAIQAAVTSGALQSSEFKTQLNIVFPPLIVTLSSCSNNDTFNNCDGSIDIRDSALDNGNINTTVIERLAAHTISILFNKMTGPSVRLSLIPLFEYMNEQKRWWPPSLAINIMKLVLDSIQPQYRYLVISEILHQLDINKGETNDKHASLISILDAILNASIPLVGISVLEVLNSLFTLLIKTTKQPKANEKVLVHAMGGLASQTYYENQLRDIIGYLISKLRPSTSLESVDSLPLHEYRVLVLSCLDSMVVGSKQTPEVDQEPLDAWNPALGLLCDKNPLTRILFSQSLWGFLQTMVPKVIADKSDKYPQHSSTLYHDAMFIDRMVHTLLDWISLSDFNKTDLLYFYSFLCILTRHFGIDATVMIVPLVFKIQQLIQHGQITLYSRQAHIQAAVVSLFEMMAGFYHIQTLRDYISQFDKMFFTESIDILQVKEIELFEQDIEGPPLQWIDRSRIVEILSKDGQLRDERDTHGLELEAKLFAEWGSDAFLKNDQHIMARIMLESPVNGKPKLSSPWEHSDVELSPIFSQDNNNRRDSIRVSNLKEALVAQIDEEDDISESTQQTHHSTSSKPPALPTKDMNAFLHELNLPHKTSTLSLVNPPYKSS